MGTTSIEWTRGDDGVPGATWNPIRGCSRVSPGCEHCYAERIAGRFSGPGQPFEGFATREHGGRWTRRVSLLGQDKLDEPLSWRAPRRVFVNSQSDLFHEGLTFEQIAAVFGIMASPGARKHTFQILTKRPERMLAFFRWLEQIEDMREDGPRGPWATWVVYTQAVNFGSQRVEETNDHRWPLPNVWLGVSVESQKYADDRIHLLLQTPAAVRFLSCEPLLEAVDLKPWLYVPTRCRACGSSDAHYDTNPRGLPVTHECRLGVEQTGEPGACRCSSCGSLDVEELSPLNWVIVGGEAGHGARPFDLVWARSLRDQCKAARVAYFFKQAGSAPVDGSLACKSCGHPRSEHQAKLPAPCLVGRPIDAVVRAMEEAGAAGRCPVRAANEAVTAPTACRCTGFVGHDRVALRHPKGSDLSELPPDLRVREFPGVLRG